jgi:hypothetical protein
MWVKFINALGMATAPRKLIFSLGLIISRLFGGKNPPINEER